MTAPDAPAGTRPWLARPAWLRRIERRLRPLDHLSRGAALGAGAAAGVGAGFALGWTGEPWTLAPGALLLAGAGWLVASAQPVAVVQRKVEAVKLPPAEPPSPQEPTPVEPPAPLLSEALGMVDLPGGRFWMGSAEEDPRAYPDEHPRHEIEVGPFAMGKYVVTQKLYREVMSTDPGRPKGDDLPANNVSWFDAVRFCNRLSERKGLAIAYFVGEASVTWRTEADGYRLPTEAEWEYACRAGTETAYSFGDDAAPLDEYAWWDDNAEREPHPVGTRKPNSWGLFDVHGNVHEWCWDPYGPYDKPRPTGGLRVVRGGSYSDSHPRFLRSANRFRDPPGNRLREIGFRCARGGSRQP
jgi:formylglycine-generating enzyme required for sulfatase activity